MNKIDLIRKFIKKKKLFTSRDIQEKFDISRAMSARYIKKLLAEGNVLKKGRTNGAYYIYGGVNPISPLGVSFSVIVEGASEDVIYNDIAEVMNFKRRLNVNAVEIAQYIITEMINNVLEHSDADKFNVEVNIDAYKLCVVIKDFGIGIFNRLMEDYKLDAIEQAILMLIKGKTTTKPEGHSGEGIFFSMRASDLFIIRSERSIIKYSTEDIIVGKERRSRGTAIKFCISINTRRKLKEVFDRYAGEDFDFKFDKTSVRVSIVNREKRLVSRSEAKRIYAGLDKFSHIELDFKGVISIGQGFAHEIFNVFVANHPGISISVKNANPAVKAMIMHVLENKSIVDFL